ncbi:hypothetical protein NEFER03_1114 [Nematocida sp. LUAm3]|nr:hypothetical protein NEFER03_1114 [Nematocida sp. LUAm3]KAI5175759.1 hypothetical protein NEFER02_1628 [Nematocida sp. LUAm2]KAI5178228.1 hypothetical protein NEFER01_1395 [Nematocida sp. LUAm1]
MKEIERKEETPGIPIQAFPEEEESSKAAPTKVLKLAKELEKSLDINHFLNTRFNRQNHSLYEKLRKERENK